MHALFGRPKKAVSERAKRWQADGIKVNKLPPHTAQLSMRGGQALLQPVAGDDVELYVDQGTGKPGKWVSGYVAGSGVEQGEVGGPYDGQETVFVCKRQDYTSRGENGPLRGSEWPLEHLRLERSTSKTPFAGRDAASAQDGAHVDMSEMKLGSVDDSRASFYGSEVRIEGLAFFRFNPAELRDYEGKWAEGGATHQDSSLPLIEQAVRVKSGDAVWSGAKWMAAHGVTIESSRQHMLDLYYRAPKELRDYDAKWYYRANALVSEWSRKYNVQTWRGAGVLAATSPQTSWSVRPSFAPRNSNQNIAMHVMEIAFEPKWTEQHIKITPAQAAQFEQDQWDEYVAKKLKDGDEPNPDQREQQLHFTSYNGMDPAFQQGQAITGEYVFKDLPVDVQMYLARKYVGGLQDNTAKALLIARGADPDDVLGGGGKTRSFYNNILDPWHSTNTTIDVHMARALTNNLALSDKMLGQMTGQGDRYRILDEGIRAAARQLGIQPHVLQAIGWEEWRREHDAAERSKLTKSGQTNDKGEIIN